MPNTLTSAIDVTRAVASPDQLRAVAYLRISTEEQKKGYGIAYTARKVLRHFERKGWTHVDTFADEGYSGTLEAHERPEIKRLMEMARRRPRPFDLVSVSEARAIGRRDRAFWPWVWELEELGVFVAVVKGGYDNTTGDGRSRMRKDTDRAEDERVTIRDRTQGGIQEKAEDGGWAGGTPPYGWRIEDKGERGLSRLIPDRCSDPGQCSRIHEYDVLHRARELIVVDLKNGRQAARRLNAEGLMTRSGKPWSGPNFLHRLFSEAVLEGTATFHNPGRIKVTARGAPRHGETVTLRLEPIFCTWGSPGTTPPCRSTCIRVRHDGRSRCSGRRRGRRTAWTAGTPVLRRCCACRRRGPGPPPGRPPPLELSGRSRRNWPNWSGCGMRLRPGRLRASRPSGGPRISRTWLRWPARALVI